MEGRPANRDWPVALTGAAFIVLLVVGFIVMGETPTAADDSAEEIVSFYVDNESSVIAGVVLLGFAALSVLFFGGYLRAVFRAAEGEPGGMLPTLVAVAAAVMAVGIAIDATITAAIVAAADDVDPTAVQALQALWDNDFLPIALGILAFLLATGISIIRHAALPVWLGWVAIVLVALYVLAGATNLDAIWVVASLGSALWVLVVSVVLAVRGRKAVA